jgi:mono/diheme cytochrome c family protein
MHHHHPAALRKPRPPTCVSLKDLLPMRAPLSTLALTLLVTAPGHAPAAAPAAIDFVRDIQPIFQEHCTSCHGADRQRSGYRLDSKDLAFDGGDYHAPNIVPDQPDKSSLFRLVAGLDPDLRMPAEGPPLAAHQIETIRSWIAQGAPWPDEASAQIDAPPPSWALHPMVPHKLPTPSSPPSPHPIDAFIAAQLEANGLQHAPLASPRTLIRRLYYDLIGLPPTFDQVEAFAAATAHRATHPDSPDPYTQLVDELLASPHYGERWGRHWLDVVHFGETHGYDKDKPRPNAWPYRDYVIQSLNDDKPYPQFVREQLAADVLHPDRPDAVVALGFLAAGPWDYIGHAEVAEDKIDGKIARHLDRDDMVSTTINTFASLTVHCASCHDHKFDPISQHDYYSLQAVFSALDRADRAYDPDPDTAASRHQLLASQSSLSAQIQALEDRAATIAGQALDGLDQAIALLQSPPADLSAHFGWHSDISPAQDAPAWVQVNLGQPQPIAQIVLRPASDPFNNIGDGFGFPLQFRIEASDDPAFPAPTLIADTGAADLPNPGIDPVTFPADTTAQHIRITATSRAPRNNDFIFALAELQILSPEGANLAAHAPVTSSDSIESAPRWARANLTDGWYPGLDPAALTPDPAALEKLAQARQLILQAALGDADALTLSQLQQQHGQLAQQLAALPPPAQVYAATIHHGTGAFRGTGPDGGRPRPIHLLHRGEVTQPRDPVAPGAIQGLFPAPATFDLPPDAPEGQRRAALAEWLTHPDHPTFWRSIVNRVWHYHFGRGLVTTPNDFGLMGEPPSHPELLDWLALTFRDDLGASLKSLHRLIVTSHTYRQRSDSTDALALEQDAANSLLWRQNRRKLEAEAVRDSILAAAGKLDLTLGGPSFQDFVILNPAHSPHYEYHLADPDNPALHRRAVYRFAVRSKQQPWMAALDCADPSMLVDVRDQSINAPQALAMLNNPLVITMATHFADRLKPAGPLPQQVSQAFLIALQRQPTPEELAALVPLAETHGLPNLTRLLLNLNEFTFID